MTGNDLIDETKEQNDLNNETKDQNDSNDITKDQNDSNDETKDKTEQVVTFESLNLNKVLCEICKSLNWKNPTKIQRETLPYSLAGKDIIGLAETGSGKTGAFALPILNKLLETNQRLFALILTPTRELAIQIKGQFQALGEVLGVESVVIIGGLVKGPQELAIKKKPHIIIATPGRLVEHLETTKNFNLNNIKFLVLDEADRILNLDFEKELDQILRVLPKNRTTYLFSATMTNKVRKLEKTSLNDPVRIEVSSKYQTVENLKQYYLFLPDKYKDVYLAYILIKLAGNSFIVFTNTCNNSHRLTFLLRNLGLSAIPLFGKMNQATRLGSLNKFKSKSRSILIATDVASRGLDIPHVDIVINYDLPTHSKDYIHRVGRTARAGKSGKSIALVTQYDVELFQRIEHLIGKKLDQYEVDKNEVMNLVERVSEAQRVAKTEMNELKEEKGRKKTNLIATNGHETDLIVFKKQKKFKNKIEN